MDDERPGMAEEDDRESFLRYCEGLSPAERRERIQLVPAYRDAYNELVQAHRTVEQPSYFWERWVPELGPVAAVLYMKLRQHCFYAGAEGPDVCWPRQDALAREIGIRCCESLRSALALLEREGFIEREPASRFDGRTGRPVRTTDRYRVFFELPLRPGDAAELFLRSVHQIPIDLGAEKAGKPPFGPQSQLAGIPPLRQTDTVENAGIPPFGTPGAENAGIPPIGSQSQNAGIPPFGDRPETQCGRQKHGIPPFGENAGIPPATLSTQRFQRSTLSCTENRVLAKTRESVLFEEPPAQRLSEELAEELEDPESIRWYRLIADKLPEGRIRIVLSETRSARDEGRLRGSPGAYFTGAIRRVALELGISL